MAEKTRYSDAELEEFRTIIMEKLQLAERDYEKLKSSIMNTDGNDTDDTSPHTRCSKKVPIHCLRKKQPAWRHDS